MADFENGAPPVGEELHLPNPSLVPFLNAIGVALALVGLTVTLLFTWVGLVIFIVTLVFWIRDNRRDISDLPAEHRASH
jgi:hypothetical protein